MRALDSHAPVNRPIWRGGLLAFVLACWQSGITQLDSAYAAAPEWTYGIVRPHPVLAPKPFLINAGATGNFEASSSRETLGTGSRRANLGALLAEVAGRGTGNEKIRTPRSQGDDLPYVSVKTGYVVNAGWRELPAVTVEGRSTDKRVLFSLSEYAGSDLVELGRNSLVSHATGQHDWKREAALNLGVVRSEALNADFSAYALDARFPDDASRMSLRQGSVDGWTENSVRDFIMRLAAWGNRLRYTVKQSTSTRRALADYELSAITRDGLSELDLGRHTRERGRGTLQRVEFDVLNSGPVGLTVHGEQRHIGPLYWSSNAAFTDDDYLSWRASRASRSVLVEHDQDRKSRAAGMTLSYGPVVLALEKEHGGWVSYSQQSERTSRGEVELDLARLLKGGNGTWPRFAPQILWTSISRSAIVDTSEGNIGTRTMTGIGLDWAGGKTASGIAVWHSRTAARPGWIDQREFGVQLRRNISGDGWSLNGNTELRKSADGEMDYQGILSAAWALDDQPGIMVSAEFKGGHSLLNEYYTDTAQGWIVGTSLDLSNYLIRAGIRMSPHLLATYRFGTGTDRRSRVVGHAVALTGGFRF